MNKLLMVKDGDQMLRLKENYLNGFQYNKICKRAID